MDLMSIWHLFSNISYKLPELLIMTDVPLEEKVALIARSYKLANIGSKPSSGFHSFDTVQTEYFDYAVLFFIIGITLTWISRKWITYKMLHPDYFPKKENNHFGKLMAFISDKKAWSTPLDEEMSDEQVKWLLETDMAENINAEENIEGNFVTETYNVLNAMKFPILFSIVLPIWHFASRGMAVVSILIVAVMLRSAITKFYNTNERRVMKESTAKYRTKFIEKASRAKRSRYQ